jgi:hypothetical protein
MGEQLRLNGMPEPHLTPWRSLEGTREQAQELLDDPHASALDLLDAFAWSTLDARQRDALLAHPAVTYHDLRMALDLWNGVLRNRALSVLADGSVLLQWADSPAPKVRAIVAMNPSCPADLALRLSNDPHSGVRGNAACAPNLPSKRRLALANRDPDPAVREFVLWFITTTCGRAVVAGERYTAMHHGNKSDPDDVARITSYRLGDEPRAPV